MDKLNIETKNTGLKEFDKILLKYMPLINKGKIIDLGVGDSDNTLYFSGLGYEVEAVDISNDVIKLYYKKADQNMLTVKASVKDIRTLCLEEETYSLIIVSNVLHFLNKAEINAVIDNMKKALKKNGLIYIRVVSDYIFKYGKLNKDNTKLIYNEKYNIYKFSKDELLEYFNDYKIICYSENINLILDSNKYYSQLLLVAQKQ